MILYRGEDACVTSSPIKSGAPGRAGVGWWINPTRSHKCNYLICQRLGRRGGGVGRRALQKRLPSSGWVELLHHVATSSSSPARSVRNSFITAIIIREEQKVIVSSIPPRPCGGHYEPATVSEPQRRRRRRCCSHYTRSRTLLRHILFSNMLTSIKEPSHEEQAGTV